ncbi:MAG: signal peptidase I [Ruminococcaceae bacterium]|nr:signal peptidase I [Oscillospiraceae bacterium]
MEDLENKTPAQETQTEDSKVPGNDLYEWVRSLVTAVLIIVLVFTFAIRMMGVQGPSMRQTLQDGDRLLVLNSMLVGEYRRGDIVIARKQTFSDDPIVKRIIAVGGQTVDIDFNAGTVYVDGVEQEEDYINDRTYTFEGTEFPLTVPEGSVFLMGDNRNMSTDSREPHIGTVDERYLIGKAVVLLFPGPDSVTKERDFGRIGLLSRN